MLLSVLKYFRRSEIILLKKQPLAFVPALSRSSKISITTLDVNNNTDSHTGPNDFVPSVASLFLLDVAVRNNSKWQQ